LLLLLFLLSRGPARGKRGVSCLKFGKCSMGREGLYNATVNTV
jgi:hypothetical protein